MAIPFKEPKPSFIYNSDAEIAELENHFDLRKVPKSEDNRLLMASWNIANLGAQKRPPRALPVISHILSRFDLIAVQEVNDNYRIFEKIVRDMGGDFDFVISDKAGNAERLAFVYRVGKVQLDKLWGEVALTKNEYPKRTVVAHYRQGGQDKSEKFTNHRFVPFDRNPFIGSFRSGTIGFVLANVHLYFGAFQDSTDPKKRAKYARRVLEIFALARWANRVSSGGNAWDRDIVLLGDMNVPNMDKNESTIKALKEFGWGSLDYVSNQSIGTSPTMVSHVGGTNLGNDKTYDQIALSPTGLSGKVSKFGVFDFDNAIFKSKWEDLDAQFSHSKATSLFARYMKFHISDHRPLWVQMRTN
ncbi:MAG: endonuclease/exonuclease/phosphatase family protein [Stappiaceae bacterium]